MEVQLVRALNRIQGILTLKYFSFAFSLALFLAWIDLFLGLKGKEMRCKPSNKIPHASPFIARVI
jgi:hypothetical protein